MIQDRAIFYNGVLCDLSNYVISNDLERPLTQISRACRCSTLNISETVQDKDVVKNGILIGTFTRPAQSCNFEVTLSDSKIVNDTSTLIVRGLSHS